MWIVIKKFLSLKSHAELVSAPHHKGGQHEVDQAYGMPIR